MSKVTTFSDLMKAIYLAIEECDSSSLFESVKVDVKTTVDLSGYNISDEELFDIITRVFKKKGLAIV
jgi:hypothetical protein